MKAVLISIQPKWCELIASGKKTIEVRKTKPNIPTPFKCYIYCTMAIKKVNTLWSSKLRGKYYYRDDRSHNLFDEILNGKVIGEFVCNRIDLIPPCTAHNGLHYPLITYPELDKLVKNACLTDMELFLYGVKTNNGCYNDHSKVAKLYCLHISDLKIYDKPKELYEFNNYNKLKKCTECGKYDESDNNCYGCENMNVITRPPQSWCYVEELGQ